MIVNIIITKISLLLGCACNEEAHAKFVLFCLVFIVQILTSSVNLVLAGERAGKASSYCGSVCGQKIILEWQQDYYVGE